jgi:hypothetical protein
VPYPDSSHLDDQRERRRLAANYATMTDGELQRLARHAESLTELAWDALEDEMDRRHLEVADDPAPHPHQHLEMRELVTVRQFRDLPEALLAKGSLESAGIECFLADENLVRLDWFISNFIGGIKLNVHAPDAENPSNFSTSRSSKASTCKASAFTSSLAVPTAGRSTSTSRNWTVPSPT